MTANCIHLFRWPWRVAGWSADARIRDTDTRRPNFPSFTAQGLASSPEPPTQGLLRLLMVSLFLPSRRATPPASILRQEYLHTFLQPLAAPRIACLVRNASCTVCVSYVSNRPSFSRHIILEKLRAE